MGQTNTSEVDHRDQPLNNPSHPGLPPHDVVCHRVHVKHDTSTTWAERQTAAVGALVQRHRRRRELGQEDLAKRTVALGLPISRSKIANLENGRARREGISVAELHVLARALDVPPVALIFDPGRVEALALRRGLPAPTGLAVVGHPGVGPFGADDEDGQWRPRDVDRWRQNAAPLALHRQHTHLVAAWSTATMMRPGEAADDLRERLDAAPARRGELEADLRRVRESMRMLGLRPPPLPDLLADALDEDGDR